jgi:hypothetical protein
MTGLFARILGQVEWDTGNEMPVDDTSQRAREVYFRRLAEMTPCERIGVGVALWAAGDSTQRTATRQMHPAADDDEINFRVAVSRYGLELASKAYRRQ